MPGITGMATTYNLPQYAAELFGVSVEDTPLLSSIGGLTGGVSTGSTFFEWQTYDLRDADENRQRLEGAKAPDGEERVRSTRRNVLEIHQEAIELSYTRQAINRQAYVPDGEKTIQIGNSIIPVSEFQWQIDQALKQIARDVDKGFIVGKQQIPTDNTKPRKTRGLIEAITTNVVAGSGALTKDMVLDTFQKAWENGGIQETSTRTILVGPTMRRQLTKVFSEQVSRFSSVPNVVGGVTMDTISTDFGNANIMVDRYVPADTMLIVSLEELKPMFLDIPGKGHFFVEPLAKTGAADKVQMYGEIGLNYGSELHHAKLTVAKA